MQSGGSSPNSPCDMSIVGCTIIGSNKARVIPGVGFVSGQPLRLNKTHSTDREAILLKVK